MADRPPSCIALRHLAPGAAYGVRHLCGDQPPSCIATPRAGSRVRCEEQTEVSEPNAVNYEPRFAYLVPNRASRPNSEPGVTKCKPGFTITEMRFSILETERKTGKITVVKFTTSVIWFTVQFISMYAIDSQLYNVKKDGSLGCRTPKEAIFLCRRKVSHTGRLSAITPPRCGNRNVRSRQPSRSGMPKSPASRIYRRPARKGRRYRRLSTPRP